MTTYCTFFATGDITPKRLTDAMRAYERKTGATATQVLVNRISLEQTRAALAAANLPLTLTLAGGILTGEFWLTHED